MNSITAISAVTYQSCAFGVLSVRCMRLTAENRHDGFGSLSQAVKPETWVAFRNSSARIDLAGSSDQLKLEGWRPPKQGGVMKKTRFTEQQMMTILRQSDQRPVPEVAKKHGIGR